LLKLHFSRLHFLLTSIVEHVDRVSFSTIGKIILLILLMLLFFLLLEHIHKVQKVLDEKWGKRERESKYKTTKN